MERNKFLKTLQEKISHRVLEPETLGYHNEINEIEVLRNYASSLDLSRYGQRDGRKFRNNLDEDTQKLASALEPADQKWGVSRTALNLFLGEALYNRYLSEVYELFLSEHFFELPLTHVAAENLRRQKAGDDLPEWSGLLRLNSNTSGHYQQQAAKLAEGLGISRIHLPLFLWPGE